LEDCIKSHMLWEFRYWITHVEEERIRVVEDEPELLLSWIPDALTLKEEREVFRNKHKEINKS
jgi:hypothetical protein